MTNLGHSLVYAPVRSMPFMTVALGVQANAQRLAASINRPC